LTKNLYVGGYFLYGFASNSNSAQSTCPYDPDTSCGASQIRFGAVADWHFRPQQPLDPWAGAGLGYEIVNLVETSDVDGSTIQSSALDGMLLTLEGGVDYKPAKYFGLGPYVEIATGHYWSSTTATTMHEWVTFGARLRTNL
jgi:hypothetical protein